MIGASLNQYQITAPIGAGGMGEVFRGRKDVYTVSAQNRVGLLDIGYAPSGHLLYTDSHVWAVSFSLPKLEVTGDPIRIFEGFHGITVADDGTLGLAMVGLAKLRSADAHIRAKGTPGGELADVGIRAPDAEASTVVQSAVESTELGMVLGTPAYLAPEQVRGEPANHRADIFAFGCVLYEMLSGLQTFRRNTPVESMNAVLSEEPPDLNASNAYVFHRRGHPEIPRPCVRSGLRRADTSASAVRTRQP